MPTAKNSNRFDGGIRNPSFELWASGEPVNWDATTTNATLVQLTKQMGDFQRMGIFQVEVTRLALPPFEKFVADGFSAPRMFATSAWTARSVNLRVSGTVAALTGDADWGLPWDFESEGRLSFWARGTADKEIEVLFAMRSSDGTLRTYLNAAPGTWSTTQTGVAIGLEPRWQQYTINVRFPFIVDDGGTTGEVAGPAADDSLVFGFYNVSTADPANGDPFVWEVDNLLWQLHGYASHEES